jgi:hypothetical protein
MAWYRAAVDGRSAEPADVLSADAVSGDAVSGDAVSADAVLDGAGSAHPMAGRVVRYNEDDVLATLAVRRWITEHLDELPTVADLQ